MEGTLQCFGNFFGQLNAKENHNTIMVCKECGHEIHSHVYSGSTYNEDGTSESFCRTIIECTFPECPRYINKDYSYGLTDEQVNVLTFDTPRLLKAYLAGKEKEKSIARLKGNASQFKIIKKRVGKKIHSCEVCGKDMEAGSRVHARTSSYSSFRGRHYSVSEYIHEECWNHYILPTSILVKE